MTPGGIVPPGGGVNPWGILPPGGGVNPWGILNPGGKVKPGGILNPGGGVKPGGLLKLCPCGKFFALVVVEPVAVVPVLVPPLIATLGVSPEGKLNFPLTAERKCSLSNTDSSLLFAHSPDHSNRRYVSSNRTAYVPGAEGIMNNSKHSTTDEQMSPIFQAIKKVQVTLFAK